MNNTVNQFFGPLVEHLGNVLFWDPFAAIGLSLGAKVPFIVVWLIAGGIFFTIYLKFINIRGLKHGINLALGRDKLSIGGGDCVGYPDWVGHIRWHPKHSQGLW